MRVRKRLSKRVSTRQRNNVQKKVAEHHRKSRKIQKNKPKRRARKPKDLGIPNSFPFKEAVIAEREEVRRRAEEEKIQKRLEARSGNGERKKENGKVVDGERKEENGFVKGIQLDGEDDVDEEEMSEFEEESDEDEDDDVENEIDEEEEEDEEGMDDDLESSESEWEGIESDLELSDVDLQTQVNTARNSKPPAYVKALLKSDLVIFVLDARGPTYTRCLDLEFLADKKGKKSIFILNRAELVPPEILQHHITTLEDKGLVFPFFSETSRFPGPFEPAKSIKALKSHIFKEEHTFVTIIGIPRIGKSTILKSVLDWPVRTSPLQTTRAYAWNGDYPCTLIDTPAAPPTDLPPSFAPLLGLAKPDKDTITLLLNAINEMPEEYWSKVEKLYGIPALLRPIEGNRFVDPAHDLLVHVARKFGRISKHGPNLEAAAQIVVQDCLDGKIVWWIKEV